MYIFLAHVLLGFELGFFVDFWFINHGAFKLVFGDFWPMQCFFFPVNLKKVPVNILKKVPVNISQLPVNILKKVPVNISLLPVNIKKNCPSTLSKFPVNLSSVRQKIGLGVLVYQEPMLNICKHCKLQRDLLFY